MSLWAAGRWSSPPGGVGGRRCTNRCITNTKHLKRRPACLASRFSLSCSHRLRIGLGAAAPETTLHCSTSKSDLPSQWASRLGQHSRRDTCEGAQTGQGELPPRSRRLGLLTLALPVIARYSSVTFQKRILISGAALQVESSGPEDHAGNPTLAIAPDEGGRRSDFCPLSCLPLPAGGSDKCGCSPCVLSYIWYVHCPGSLMQCGFAGVNAKGPGSVVVAVGIIRTAKICLIHLSVPW